MRHVRMFSSSWICVLAIVGAAAAACSAHTGNGFVPPGSDDGGSTTGNDAGGTTGDDGGTPAPCTGASDSRLVVAPQRIVKLTRQQVINTIGVLINNQIATQLLSDPNYSDISDETGLRFPPLVSHGEAATISGDPTSLPQLDSIAQTAAQYVHDNFAAVTGCTTSTDTCATGWINKFAAAAYRRPLASGEQTRVTGLYNASRSQTLNQWPITSTIEEATQNTVYGILMSPQMLWRSEIGDTAHLSTSPPGVPLTDYELATLLSYTITNGPPDAMLLADAAAGKLRANLAAETQRLLSIPASKTWLTTMMFVYYRFNLLYNSRIDTTLFPAAGGNTLADMHQDAHQTLDYTLWNGSLTDLLLSRTAFVNTNLATNIYQIQVPVGATATNFVRTMLPQDQRSGVLTNAAYITSRAGSDRESVVQRALLIKDTLLCLQTPPPPMSVQAAVTAAKASFGSQTAQEQVAFRAGISPCKYCHGTFDMYGLVLDGFDNIARWRTTVTVTDANGNQVMKPVDPHTHLPDSLGGGPVTSAVDMAQKLAASDLFATCLARNVLQYTMSEYDTSAVEMPTPPADPANPYPPTPFAGCAALDVAGRYKSSSGQTFTDMLNATVTSPSFALRAQ